MTDRAEKSRLLNKHRDERTTLEKQLKKAKGAMKAKFETELEEMEKRHEREVVEMEVRLEGAGGGSEKKKEEEEDEDSDSNTKEKSKSKKSKKSDKDKDKSSKSESSKPIKKKKLFPQVNWMQAGYSKKELEEACTERGLGKKGSKDDLQVKLVSFQHEQMAEYKENPEMFFKEDEEKGSDDDDSDGEDSSPVKGGASSSSTAAPNSSKAAKNNKKPLDNNDDDEENDDDDDDSDDDSDEDAALPEVSPEEMEKQHKREQHVRKALRHVLMKKKTADEEKEDGDGEEQGVALDDLPALLDSVVKGFTPQICGYANLKRFVKCQQPKFCLLDKKSGKVFAPEK